MNLRSIRIKSGEQAPVSIAWGDAVSGNQALGQKAFVNLLTNVGSSLVLPRRGTSIEKQIVQGRGYNAQAIQHLLNFAALDTRNSTQPAIKDEQLIYPDEHLLNVTLQLDVVKSGRVRSIMNFRSYSEQQTQQTIDL
jgi:hypothetical protein